MDSHRDARRGNDLRVVIRRATIRLRRVRSACGWLDGLPPPSRRLVLGTCRVQSAGGSALRLRGANRYD